MAPGRFVATILLTGIFVPVNAFASPLVVRSYATTTEINRFQPTKLHMKLPSPASILQTAVTLRGGQAGEVSDLVEAAYGWCTGLGGPAALVAGAVIATMYENLNSGDLELEETDKKWVAVAKKTTRMLLLSAFALETMCIFCTTVTGTMLLSRPVPDMAKIAKITSMTTPLSFLKDNFEFEYLTASLAFLQGLLHWLAAIGLGHAIPKKDESTTSRKLNKFVSWSLGSTIVLMLAFFNSHISFYANYWQMLTRWTVVTWHRFIWHWPPRSMAVVFVPTMIMSMYYGFKAVWDGAGKKGVNGDGR